MSLCCLDTPHDLPSLCALFSPSTTTALWWRRQQLHAFPPACHSPFPTPGKGLLPDTLWASSCPPHLMLGTLATQGILDPQLCGAAALKEGEDLAAW